MNIRGKSKGRNVSFDDAKNEFQDFKSDFVDQLNIDGNKGDAIQNRLYRMIDYAIGRHDWYDKQRHRFLQIGISLLAAGATLAAVSASLTGAIHGSSEWLAWTSVFSLILTGIFLIYNFNASIESDHPYRKVVDIKSWYFKYNLPLNEAEHLSRQTSRAQNQVDNIVKNVKSFLNRWDQLLNDERGFLKEDFEQVFILQLIQRYRSQQIKKMSKILLWGLSMTAISLILATILHVAMDSRSSNTSQDGLEAKSANQSSIFHISEIKIDRLIFPDSTHQLIPQTVVCNQDSSSKKELVTTTQPIREPIDAGDSRSVRTPSTSDTYPADPK